MNRKFVFILLLAVVLVIFLLLYFFFKEEKFIEEFEVKDVSMSGLVDDGEMIKVDFDYYKSNEIQRGDLVLFKYAGNENLLLKEVHGVPGDIFDLQIKEGKAILFINGRPAVNSEGLEYSFSGSRRALLTQYIIDYNNRIPEDAYLLLGNLADGSVDSGQFGLVSSKDVLGRVVNIAPLDP